MYNENVKIKQLEVFLMSAIYMANSYPREVERIKKENLPVFLLL